MILTPLAETDEQGSTLALTDESGTATDQFAYSPYGQVLGHAGTNSTAFQWLGGYGVYYDASANLHLTLHRAYSADMRRWLSTDPMGIDGGPNLYAYCDVNPLTLVDPSGMYGVPGMILGGISGATGGGIKGYANNGWEGAAQGIVIGGIVGAGVGFVFPNASGPMAIAAVSSLSSATANYAGQVVVNGMSGSSLKQSLTDVNTGSIVGSAAGGAIAPYFSSLLVSQVPAAAPGAVDIMRGVGAVGKGMITASSSLIGGSYSSYAQQNSVVTVQSPAPVNFSTTYGKPNK